jgi:prepilin-type N-terminal cleavage/methylation domain-containing protein
MNYKKLKHGFSIAELLVALSIFALISTLGVEGFSFMLKNQIKHRIAIEKKITEEVKIYNCKKELYYQHLYKQHLDPPLNSVTCSDLMGDCQTLKDFGC